MVSLRAGASLTRLAFPCIGSPGTISWNQGTTAVVVFAPHRERCEECLRFLEVLGGAAEGLRDWATKALVLTGPGQIEVGSAPPGVYLADDSAGRGRAQLGIGDDQAAVVQADRWGAVYQAEVVESRSTSHGNLPTPRDLVSLAQYIDIQCPECGVPSKEWLGATPFPLG